MNKKMKSMLAATLLLLGSSALSAQEKVSLQEAIQLALQNKAEAKKAALQIQKAEYKIAEAKAGALPQIAASANLAYNPIIQESLLEFGGQRIRAQLGQPWSSSAVVTLNQAIFDQRVFIGLKAARSTREFYVLNAELTNEQIIENVATAYYQVFVQEENLRTLDLSLANTQKVRNVIKSLVDNGLAKPIDLDRANVQLTNIRANRQQMQNGMELSKNALKFYMGIPIATPIELEEKTIDVHPELLADTPNLDERTQIRVLNKNHELLEFNKKATEAFRYPTVGLQANYGLTGQGGKFPLTNGLNQGVLWSDYSTIGLNINVPIFNGEATKSRIQQAEIDILDNEQDIANAKLSLDLDYKNAVTNIENSMINIENMKGNVALAEKVERNTQANYQYGLATLTEVIDADNALTNARQNYADAMLDYKQAEIKLLKAKGTLTTLQTQP